jgi:hypothetical protein
MMNRRRSPHRVYLAARGADPVTLQNTLLTTPDVELAVVLFDLEQDEVEAILSKAGGQKRDRVLDQREKLARVRVNYRDCMTVQDRFISRLDGSPAVSSRRYFRPSRR